MNDDNFSKASLEAEIISLERSLEELELKREELKGSTFIVKQPHPKQKQQPPLPIRWNELTIQTDSLVFAKDFCEWRETFARKVNANFGGIDLFLEAEMCVSLAQLIGKYSNIIILSLPSLYEEYYLPLFEYCYEHLIQLFRQELSRFHYPKHCSKLIATCRKNNNKKNNKKKQQQQEQHGGIKNSTTTTIQIIAQRLTNLERQHGHLISLLEINDDDDKSHITITTTTPPVVVLELLAPIVEKVKFHFVTPSSDRITTQRIDRLPEWLLSYLREQHVVVPLQQSQLQQQKQHKKRGGGSGGPYELAMLLFQEDDKEEDKNEEHGLSQTVLVTHHFRNELVRLVQWVLETRNFFRNSQIISNQPILLYNAMEEFIQFDKELQIMTAASVTHNNNNNTNNNQYPPPPLLGLMDCLVCSDDELMHWWIQRERESVFSMLLLDDDDDDHEHDTVGPAAANHVSPRAELFCALIRSTRYKASVLSVPALYLKQVVVPLCTQFVDALQETSAEAIARLCRRPSSSSSSRRRIYNGDGMPTTSELAANIYKWIQILNGTHLAAQIIGPDATATSWQQDGGTAAAISRSDHDLARFGRSLEHLKGVLVDEFGTAYCETIIMERAKCASYIMLASHLLASRPEDRNDIMTTTDDDEDWWLSVELRDTKVAVDILTKVCDSVGGGISSHDANGPTTGDGGQQEHNQQQQQQQQQRLAPPLEMKKQVMERLAGKFMEVAMDIHAMTPDIYQAGAKVFARDVKIMFQSSSSSFPLCRRLVDVVTLMTMDSKSSQGLFYALSGLTGSKGGRGLDIRDLVNDERLFEEASNMVRAKGLVSLELEDVISILNRRRD